MKTHYSFNTNNCTIYPGEYIPMLDADELMNELKKTDEKSALQPCINVSEHDNYYKVEAAIPGLNREDFFVNIDENILSISVLHKEEKLREEKKFQLHEFDYECFNRNIILPQNIEKDFIKAEYKGGILSFYFPKSDSPDNHPHSNIIVY